MLQILHTYKHGTSITSNTLEIANVQHGTSNNVFYTSMRGGAEYRTSRVFVFWEGGGRPFENKNSEVNDRKNAILGLWPNLLRANVPKQILA